MKEHAFAISCWIFLAFVALVPLAIVLGYLPGCYAMDNLGMDLLLVSLVVIGPVAMLSLLLGSRKKTKELEMAGESQMLWKKVLRTMIAATSALFMIGVLEMFGSEDVVVLPLLYAYCMAGVLVVMNLLRIQGRFQNSDEGFRKVKMAGRAVLLLSVSAAALVVVMMFLSRPTSTPKNEVMTQPQETMAQEEPSDDPDFYAGSIDLDPYFAMLPPMERSEAEAEWPLIPGIERASCLEFCQRDTCYCERLVLLIGSPKERPLLEWVNEYVRDYLDGIGYERLRMLKNPKDAAQIVDYYVGQARERIREERCRHDPDESGTITEQNALFVGVALQDEEICTFMTHTWYDQLSCGDGTKRSWYSVMRRTGRELKYQDFISEEDEDAFLDLLIANLRNHAGLWIDVAGSVDRNELLASMDGCALVEEGLVVYYHPYAIGCGADGQFNALIPYEDLLTVLRPDCPVKGLMTQI